MRNRVLAVSLAVFMLLLAACTVNKENAVNVPCGELMEIVLESADFPATIVVDEQYIEADFGLDKSDFTDYAIVQQAVSVDLSEVIILKAADGKTDRLLEQLKARKQQLNDTLAFYPNQTESAAAAVVGEKNGYVYLICHKDAAQAEKALLDKLNE